MNKNKLLGICILAAVEKTKRKIDVLTLIVIIAAVVGFIAIILELFGFFGDVGITLALLSILITVLAGYTSTRGSAEILLSIDKKTSMVCDAVREEGEKTRSELKEVLVEIRDRLGGTA